jgi:hypothetical protein
VVQVIDGHNLVGNPNFETGLPDGWLVNGVGTLAVNTVTGGNALELKGRTLTTTGQKYLLPIGAAKYNIVFNVLHTGAMAHNLILVASYTCLGSSPVTGAAIATAPTVMPNAWTMLSGTVTMPPADAAPGCRLTEAAVHVQQEPGTCGTTSGAIECPNLYVDNVSITLAP